MKINGQAISAREFAFDGCHKIYLLEDEADRTEARISEFNILPITSLRNAFNESCGLQFISNWKLTKSFVRQFEEARFEA